MAVASDPTGIAREALRQLTSRRVAPTPDNYRKLYDEIAGVPGDTRGIGAEEMLGKLAADLSRTSPGLARVANALEKAVAEKNWNKSKAALMALANAPPTHINGQARHASQNETPPALAGAWADLIRELLKQWEARHDGLTTSKKREGLERVLIRFAAEPANLHAKLQALLKSWSEPTVSPAKKAVAQRVEPFPEAVAIPPTPGSASPPSIPDPQSSILTGTADDVAGQLRELLVRALESAVAGQLAHAPDLAGEAMALAQQARTARDGQELTRFAAGFKQFCFKLELRGEDGVKLQQGLLRLFNLLMENISELLGDDQWLRGQIAVLREIMSSPLDLQVIDRAECSLKQVIFKQGVLKHSLNEAKTTLKNMVTRFIDRVGELSETTGEFHDKIEHYSQQISHTEDLGELNRLLTEVMRETRHVQASALRSRDDLLAAREEVDAAQAKIKQLEAELKQVSEKVLEDQLTGTLNRRGLDNAFEREAARADRQQLPLCLALLDIDNFKRINDTHGHQVGDSALKYLVNIVKDTLRPDDVVARFGGEEFLVLLPDTGMDEALSVMSRLQRNLTKKFFLHNNERVLITFSAGVAQRMPGEAQDGMVARADKALYRGKQAGKNRVLAAQ
jgi:diguanylate cyclase